LSKSFTDSVLWRFGVTAVRLNSASYN